MSVKKTNKYSKSNEQIRYKKRRSVKNLKLITCIFSQHKLEQKKLKCNFKAAYESYGHQETIYISSRKLPNYFTTSIVNSTISIYLSAGYVDIWPRHSTSIQETTRVVNKNTSAFFFNGMIILFFAIKYVSEMYLNLPT